MKKIFIRSCILVLACILAVGCGNGNKNEDKSDVKKIEFATKNLDGEDVDNTVFEKYDLTMINIWGTYCGPCIEEMPMLQEIYEEVKEKKVNLIGVVSDAETEETIKIAKEILKTSEANFMNIVPDEKLANGIFQDLQGVPTTIFVDSKGQIVGDEILGAVSKEDYIAAIESRLKGLKEK